MHILHFQQSLNNTRHPVQKNSINMEDRENLFSGNLSPFLKYVPESKNEDEIVTAEDYEIEAGSEIDVEHDFTGIKFSSHSLP